jgi:polyisoprenoid-binding protein YceI
VVLGLAAPPILPAQEAVFELDPAQTHIEFTLPEVIRAVHGTFKLKSGSIRFDLATGKAGGLVVVDVESEESDNVSLDRKIQAEVLETRKYPEAIFTPLQIDGRLEAEGESPLQLSGILKLRGKEHELMVETTVTRSGGQLTASTHFMIPYVDWGLKNPGGLLLRVGNQVQIDLKTVGRINLPASISK